MRSVTILAGCGKDGRPEPFDSISLERGGLYTIVGNTGSGKSRFIKDIEQLACGDSITGRRVLLDGVPVPLAERQRAHPPIWWPIWARICALCWMSVWRSFFNSTPAAVTGGQPRQKFWPLPMKSPQNRWLSGRG